MNQLDNDLQYSRSWQWVNCINNIKKVSKDVETFYNLSSQIALTIQKDHDISKNQYLIQCQSVQPDVQVQIKQAKQFMYTEGVGWNWHKSWNIPNIEVFINLKDPQTGERLAPPEKLFAELNIVKPIINEISSFHLLDVGINGNNRVDFENGQAIFSGLKFDTTSYNHDHAKFHFAITIFLNNPQFQYHQIIETQISPPIFVDSRKTARDNLNKKQSKIHFYPFDPELLDKIFFKRDSKVKSKNEEEISPDISGFLKYFSAANIRNKIRHPLFLALKFHKCIKLYINEQENSIQSGEDIIKYIQFILVHGQESEKKNFILVVESNNDLSKSQWQMKRFKEFMEPLQNENIKIMIDPVSVPKNFTRINRLEELQYTYKQMYPKLINEQLKIKNQQNLMKKQQISMDYSEDSEIRNGMTISKVIVIQGYDKRIYVKKQEELLDMKLEHTFFDHIYKNERIMGE